MHLATYLGLLQTGCSTLATSYRHVAAGHPDEADVVTLCLRFADECGQQAARMSPFVRTYGTHPDGEPERVHADVLGPARTGGLGLLRELHDLYVLACYLDMAWTMVGQAAKGARDTELETTVTRCASTTEGQLKWITARMKAAAPQALLVAP
jgi:hypothetical protein